MKKFEGILFCTDLDGTLFRNDKTVSKENLEAIEYFKAEGGLFTFVTGRVPKTTVSICELIKPNAPFGCINGGGVYDSRTDEYLWNTYLPREALELVRAVDEELPEIGIQLNTKEEVIFSKDNAAMELFRRATGMPNIYRHYDEVAEPILKVVFGHVEVPMVEALERFLTSHPKADNFDFIRSEKKLYEILPKGVSKGTLLLKLSELTNIDARRTIAIGDYYNDISMIRAAGLGVAVENAVEDAKAVADYISVSNENHAIASVIDGLDRGLLKI